MHLNKDLTAEEISILVNTLLTKKKKARLKGRNYLGSRQVVLQGTSLE